MIVDNSDEEIRFDQNVFEIFFCRSKKRRSEERSVKFYHPMDSKLGINKIERDRFEIKL